MDDEPTTTAETAVPEPPTPPDPRPRGEAIQLLLWTLRFAITMALAIGLAGMGFMLGVFGLAGVALGIAVGFVVVAAAVWRRAMLPAAVLAAAIALPTSVSALSTVRFDRSVGTLNVTPKDPKDVARTTYRRGAGPVFIDLRQFRGYTGGRTAITAQADNGRVVVALPTDRCFSLSVRYETIPSYSGSTVRRIANAGLRQAGIQNGAETGMGFGSMGLSDAATRRYDRVLSNVSVNEQNAIGGLLAFGETPLTPGRYYRGAPANAPRIDLTLRSADQIILRDYPAFAGPLNDGYSPNSIGSTGEQVAGMSWPLSLQAPFSPGDSRFADRARVRTRANRARWVSWERRMVAWGTQQARRFAGPCASRQQLKDRAVQFFTQAEQVRDGSGHVTTLLGGPTTLHSSIAQRPVSGDTRMLSVEVNGLGQTTVLGAATSNDDGTYGNVRPQAAVTAPTPDDPTATGATS